MSNSKIRDGWIKVEPLKATKKKEAMKILLEALVVYPVKTY